MGNETSKPATGAAAVPASTPPPAAHDPAARLPAAQPDNVITVVTAATPTAATVQLPTANNRWSLPSIPFYSSTASATDPSALAVLPPGTNTDDLPVWYQDLIRLPKPSTTPKLSTGLRPANRSRPQTPVSRPQTPSASSSRARLATDPPGAIADNDNDKDSTHQSSTTSLSTTAHPAPASRGASWLSLFATAPSPTSPLASPAASSAAPLTDAPLVVGHLGHATNTHLARVADRQRRLGALVADAQAQVGGVAGEAVARARGAGKVVGVVGEYVGLQGRMDKLDKELEDLIARVGEVVGKGKVRFLDPASESESEAEEEENEGEISIPNA